MIHKQGFPLSAYSEFSFLAVSLSKVDCPATKDTNGFTVYITVYEACSDERQLYHGVCF